MTQTGAIGSYCNLCGHRDLSHDTYNRKGLQACGDCPSGVAGPISCVECPTGICQCQLCPQHPPGRTG